MDHRSLPSRSGTQGAACERISAAPIAKQAPALVLHADHLRATLGSAHDYAHRIDTALDRLIGAEPNAQDSGAKEAATPSCHEREMQTLGNAASELAARLHRIAQRLDSAI